MATSLEELTKKTLSRQSSDVLLKKLKANGFIGISLRIAMDILESRGVALDGIQQVTDEKIRKKYPANVEGSEEFIKATETEKPVETAEATETEKPVETAEATETEKPVETAEATETEKPVETAEATETAKKTNENSKTALIKALLLEGRSVGDIATLVGVRKQMVYNVKGKSK